jgi:hypothetical protein
MTASDMWLTNSLTFASSPGIPLNGRKLGIRWDAQSIASYYKPAYPVNSYELKIWGSLDGETKNRLVEILAVGPQELNERTPETALFFYQGSLSGLTVPYAYAIVEFTNKTGEDLGSNDLTVWVADAELLNVEIPVLGFWGSLNGHASPSVEQVRDYARVIKYLDVTVFIDRPGTLEYYEQSRNSMRLMSTYPIAEGEQKAVRIRRGGFPRFSLLIRNNSADTANCEMVAIARHD